MLLLAVMSLCSCGSNGSSHRTGGDEGGTGIQSVPGRAILGPVANARVEVFNINDFDYDIVPLCETTTTQGDIHKAGYINLPANCIATEQVYVVRVIGGMDIDFDDDGIQDSEATPVQGRFHAVLTGEHMQTRDWTVTVLSEVMYLGIIENIKRNAGNYGPADLIADVDQLASFFLTDIDGDGVIDHNDAFIWNPQEHKHINIFGEVNETIHSGKTLNDESIATQVSGYSAHLQTNTLANSLLKRGDYIYLATNAGLEIIDTRNPLRPQRSTVLQTGYIYGMEIIGQRLYLARGMWGGILTFDISDPGHPTAVSNAFFSPHLRLQAHKSDLWATNSVGGAIGFWMDRISDGTEPIREEWINAVAPDYVAKHKKNMRNGSLNHETSANGIYVKPSTLGVGSIFEIHNDLAFVAFMGFFESTTRIIDLSGEIPELVGSINLPGYLRVILDIHLEGDIVYLSVGEGAPGSGYGSYMLAYDISDPTNPVNVSQIAKLPVRAVRQGGDGLFLWEKDRLVHRNSYFTEIAHTDLPKFVEDSPHTIIAAGATIISGFNEIDIDSQNSWIQYHLMATEAMSRVDRAYNYSARIAIDDEYAYFAAGQYGLLIYPLP